MERSCARILRCHLPQGGKGRLLRAVPLRRGRCRVGLAADAASAAYPMSVAIVLYFLFRLLPTTVRPAMVTTAMRAAMRPYSMAVAPERLLSSLRMNLVI